MLRLLKDLVEKNHLSAIEAIRIGNDHELSVHVEYEKDDDLKQLAESCFLNVKALYEVIHFFIERFQKECFIRIQPIDLARFRWSIPINSVKINKLIPTEMAGELYNRLENSFKSLSNLIFDITGLLPVAAPYLRKLDEKSKYILRHTDPIFRLHEATNSLRYACYLIGRAKETDQELHDVTVYFKNMDYTYFIESAIIRIYSVFDKLAVILHQYTGLGKISTFEQFIRHYSDQPGKNPELLSHALSIYETEEYKELHQLRQDNFHHIVKENYIHRVDSEWSHFNNMVNASKNIQMLYPLLAEMLDILKAKLLSKEGL
ncbi:Cthe_2314 family HEPN domain-containing protein [Paenibacillus filicis]|uniref:Cthe_2314 family HEPN domain-containing protein n=1 Tax=Paenibacillus filicis TaxID=669464 RepID=A0ABU9DPU7_9BACL